MPSVETARLDRWLWSARLFRTRALAAAACRSGHVRINGTHAKAATPVRVSDEIRVRGDGRERIVVVSRVIEKRVGAGVAAECFVDHTPPPPTPEETPGVPVRDRGAGRPTKRERRILDQLRGR